MSPVITRSGYVALVGKPNVGKSSLMNALVGQQIAPVTHKAQTTRRNQLGILSLPEAQVIFLDTPGIHKPVNKLGTYMNEAAENAIREADLVVILCDISQQPATEDRIVAGRLEATAKGKPVIVIGNKADLVSAADQARMLSLYQQLFNSTSSIPVSAITGTGIPALLKQLIDALPQGQPYYDDDQLTDVYEREIAGELIRAACLRQLHEEVPYSIAVRIDEFKERENGLVYIDATLFVEKDSQKGIVIGKAGATLKTIGSDSRRQIEEMLGVKVYLALRVKVEKNWRNDPTALKRFGYKHE